MPKRKCMKWKQLDDSESPKRSTSPKRKSSKSPKRSKSPKHKTSKSPKRSKSPKAKRSGSKHKVNPWIKAALQYAKKHSMKYNEVIASAKFKAEYYKTH